MGNILEFTATARINSLHWITSLGENERGVTRRVLEDLEPLCIARELPFECYSPSSAKEFFAALDKIAAHAGMGMLPLIHFDTHASVDDGIRIVGSGEHVGWPEVAAKLRAINLMTRNNLGVVSGACWTCNGFAPVTYLIMPPLLRTPAG